MNGDTRGRGPSRRDFLKGLGATGAGLVAGSISAGAASRPPPPRRRRRRSDLAAPARSRRSAGE